ncbi:MAG: hypothetical protein JO233_03840 [Candidatus Eremiobacteraeota bacterium]|nr:hypothetical protein [Candidatus Eremiobacteraeota bacterium]
MKIAIVGGSSQSTPSLFLTQEMRALLSILDVRLVGRSLVKLRAVKRALQVLCSERIRVQCHTDLSGLRDSKIVILQARYGGMPARARDETFPHQFGLCGDEGLGLGGLAAAFRSWPHLGSALSAVEQYCRSAHVLLMTAPLGILTRCARQTYPHLNVSGICELPWHTLVDLAAELMVEVEAIDFDYAGINHLGWFDRVETRGSDLIDAYARKRGSGSVFPSALDIATCKAVPLRYLRMHYNPERVLHDQQSVGCRAAALLRLEKRAFDAFGGGSSAEIKAALTRRPSPWYSYAVAPFISTIAGHNSDVTFFLSGANAGYISDLPDDDVLEKPFRFHNGALTEKKRVNPLPKMLLNQLQHFVEYERVAARAVLSGDPAESRSVLSTHPWMRNADIGALSEALSAAI